MFLSFPMPGVFGLGTQIAAANTKSRSPTHESMALPGGPTGT